jgi:hypothetical protein
MSICVAVGAAACLMLAGAADSAAVLPTLYVNYVGTNCTFTITNDAGANVTSLSPGTYQMTFAAEDFVSCTNLPDFFLSGPGVSLETPIDEGTGAAANYNVTFQPSATYVAVEKSQPVLSKITITTAASGTAGLVNGPSTTGTGAVDKSANNDGVLSGKTKASTPALRRGTLLAKVSTSGKVTLSFQGKVVSQLKSGLYTVSVSDASKKSGFVIQQIHKVATSVTTAPFTGSKSKLLDLSKGQWFFYPSFIGKKTYFLVVSS